MNNLRQDRWTRVCRSFFLALLVILISQLIILCAFAADGPINAAGKQLKTLYRFKKDVKYFPIEETCNALGMSAMKVGGKWVIDGSYRGKITLDGRKGNVIERDGIVFAPETLWKKDLGLEVVDNKGIAYVLNRVVEIKKMDNGVLIVTAAPVSFKSFALDKPLRFVYDIPDLSMGDVKKDTKYDFENCPFSSVRLGQFAAFPHTGRIVVDAGIDKNFKPVNTIQGLGRNSLWIGSTKYVESSKMDDGNEDLLSKGKINVKVESDGTITLSGVAFDKASLIHLWDRAPYRVVCDLDGCHLPFKEEREFPGGGNVIRVRLAQNTEDTARLVVEMSSPVTMQIMQSDKNVIVISPTQYTLKKGFKVLIDAGHGGSDPGAQVKKSEMGGYCANEKDVNLKLALILGEMLKARGVQVFYTRTNDSFLELTQRRDMATRLGVDLFISIHNNSTPQRPQTYLSGPEVYYYYARDKKVAEAVWRNMSRYTGFQGRGHLFSRFCVIMNENIPSVLVETAYLNNMNDLSALLRPSGDYCKAAMLGVADGVSEIFGLQKGQPMTALASVQTDTEKPKTPVNPFIDKAKEFALDYPTPVLPSRDKNGTNTKPVNPQVKQEKSAKKAKPQTFSPPDKKKAKSWEEIIVLGDPEDEKVSPDKQTKGKDILSTDESVTDKKKNEKGDEILSEKEKKKRKKNIFKLY